MEDLSIDFDGGSFNVWHRQPAPGSPTVALIHGLTGTSRWWIPVISHLPPDFGIIAPDLRGRGKSWRTPGPYDLRTLAGDVSLCLDHFGLASASIAGYSMGAWVAGLLVKHHPGRAGRVIDIDGGFPIEFDRSLQPEQILEQLVGPAVARLAMEFESVDAYLDFWRRHPALADRWNPQLDDVFPYDIQKVGAVWRARANRDSILSGGSDFALDDDTTMSGLNITVPTTLLVVDRGMTDSPGGFTPLATAVEAAEANPNIEVRLLEGLNHYTLMFGDGASTVASVIAGSYS